MFKSTDLVALAAVGGALYVGNNAVGLLSVAHSYSNEARQQTDLATSSRLHAMAGGANMSAAGLGISAAVLAGIGAYFFFKR